MPAPLSLRALNRATLARQMLLAREERTPLAVIERLVALQAQWPMPPFVGVWSRLHGFERGQLLKLLHARRVVRATALRGTLHLMGAKDFASLRAALQPALESASRSNLRRRAGGADRARVAAEGRAFFAKGPQPFESLRNQLAKTHRGEDIRALAYIVRMDVPLVQVPDDGAWGFPAVSAFALAESWLGRRFAAAASPDRLVLRYLAAFGPATAADFQTWSGLPPPDARDAFARLAPKLVSLRAERGRELFDLPKAPRPAESAPVPVRFLPEFDNLLLGHADRSRVVSDAHRRAVFLPGLRVAATFLVDGFVAGTWTTDRKKAVATLRLAPLRPLTAALRDELAREGEALLRFLEPDAKTVLSFRP